MSARERRAKARKRSNTAVRRITGSTAVVATAAVGLAGPVLSATAAAISGTATQVANINTVTQGSNPSNLVDVSGTLYYSADSLTNGAELWKSTGTNGTQVADLVNGAQGSYPFDLTNANGHLFFFAQNAAGDYQLWTSNGTAAGTTPLTNQTDLFPTTLVNVGNNVSFLVDDYQNNSTDLVTSNGTANGTNDIVLANVSDAEDLTVAGTELYFAASGNTANTEGDQFVWSSNGTVNGTSEITPSTTDGSKGNGAYYSVDDLEAVGSNLYFAANGVNGGGTADQVYGVYKTPVVGYGSIPVSNFANGTTVTNLASNGGDVFFETQNTANGAALWDGKIGALGANPSDTDLRALDTSANGLVNPYLTNVNGEMYFAAENANGGPTQLFESDGTANGTNAVTNASPVNITDLVNANNTLYFAASNGNGGLWTSNGSANNGTTEVANSPNLEDLSYLANSGSTLYFSAADATSGPHLWSTGANGVKEIDANVDAADNAGSYPTDFTAVGANIFFAATSANGPGLFSSDGTSGGTSALANGVIATDLVNINGTLAFLGENTAANATEQLWTSNGSSGNGTHAVALNIGANPTELTNVNGELYFEANGLAANTTNQVQLWETNGTQAGTSQLTTFSNQFVLPEQSEAITNAGSEAYFVVNADGAAELYQSDGTVAGTFETNGTAAPSEAYIYDLTAVGGELYYVTTAASGFGLWETNGTAAGTTELLSNAIPSDLTNVNGALFFAEESSTGYALWTSNGTTATTRVVKTGVEPESRLGYGGNAMVADGSELFFTTYTSANNSTSLWESNGTSAGTTQFANFAGYSGGLTNDDGALAFADANATNGTELWTSNGTSAGTGIVADIRPGTPSGLYATSGGSGGGNGQFPDLTNAGSNLFFAADDGQDGVEPWLATGLSPVVAPSNGSGSGTGTSTTTTSTTPTTTTTSTSTTTVTTPTPPLTVTKTTVTPTPTPTPTPKPTPTPTRKASVAKLSKVSASGDALTLKLTCTAGSGNCVTTAKVEIVETIKNHKIVGLTAVVEPHKVTRATKKTIILVSKRATIKAGKSGTLKLTLDTTGQRLLTAHKKLKVELLVTQGTKTISKKTVNLTAPKKKATKK